MNSNRTDAGDGASGHFRQSETGLHRPGWASGDGAGQTSQRPAVIARIDMVAVNAAMHQLVVHPDPEVVFTHLAQLLTPAVCDEASAAIIGGGGDSDSGVVQVEPAGQSATGNPTSTRGAIRAAADGDPARFSVTIHVTGAAAPLAGSSAADYVAALTCTWWLHPPTAPEVALLELIGRCAAGAVQQARQSASVQAAQKRIDNLTIALDSNRIIGAAVGVLMTRHQLTYEQAFEHLRATSQHTNRKITAIADQVLLTGELPA